MGQVTVFSGPERRRRWSEEERLRILSEAFEPGACVAEVCRRHDISSALIYSKRCFSPTLHPWLIEADGGLDGRQQPYERTGHLHWSGSGAYWPSGGSVRHGWPTAYLDAGAEAGDCR